MSDVPSGAPGAQADGGFETRVRQSFARQQLMSTLGAQLTHVARGEVDISLPYREAVTQQHGYVHAGAVATIADSACGYAALSTMPDDAAVLSVEFKVNMLSPAEGPLIVARGRVVKSGRTITVCRADVFTVKDDGAEKIVATMQGTMMAVRGRGLTD